MKTIDLSEEEVQLIAEYRRQQLTSLQDKVDTLKRRFALSQQETDRKVSEIKQLHKRLKENRCSRLSSDFQYDNALKTFSASLTNGSVQEEAARLLKKQHSIIASQDAMIKSMRQAQVPIQRKLSYSDASDDDQDEEAMIPLTQEHNIEV